MRLLIDLNGVEDFGVKLNLRGRLHPPLHRQCHRKQHDTCASYLTSPCSVYVSVYRRKVEIMHTHSLFTLLGERLMMHTSTVTITTYNTLYEVSACLHIFLATLSMMKALSKEALGIFCLCHSRQYSSYDE